MSILDKLQSLKRSQTGTTTCSGQPAPVSDASTKESETTAADPIVQTASRPGVSAQTQKSSKVAGSRSRGGLHSESPKCSTSTSANLKPESKPETVERPQPWLELKPTKGEFEQGDLVVDDEGRNLRIESNLATQYACESLNGERVYFYHKAHKRLRSNEK